jgi:hypothetical protein
MTLFWVSLMLNVAMKLVRLRVIMLNVVILTIVILTVLAPLLGLAYYLKESTATIPTSKEASPSNIRLG